VVIVAAARVGGIHANSTYPPSSFRTIWRSKYHQGSYQAGVRKLLGSSCIYPQLARQPMREELLTGPLGRPINGMPLPIAGIKLCQAYRRQYGADFISVMPTNLYGSGDNYTPRTVTSLR
jgi:GDP-L-fucose synthase